MKHLLEPIRVTNERKAALQKEIQSLNIFLDSCMAICEHEWVEDYTCYHKGETYYKCSICGKTER